MTTAIAPERSRVRWVHTTLGESMNWGSGGTPLSSKEQYYGGGIPWVIIGDLEDGPVRTTAKTISAEGLASSSAKWVEPGSVLLAMYGSIGKLGLAEIRLTTNQAIAFAKPTCCSSKYLFYYLLWARPALTTQAKGGTQQNISQTVIKAFPFHYPEEATDQDVFVSHLEEQFSRLDAGVEALKRAQANLKRYRASVLKAACEGRLVPTEAELTSCLQSRSSSSQFETGEQLLLRILEERRRTWAGKGKYKEPTAPETSNFPGLPEGWTMTSIGQACEVFVGATPSRSRPDFWNGDIPWVSSGEVAFRRIWSTRESITDDGLASTSTDLHPAGTVLIGMIGEGKTRGQVAMLAIAACNNQNSAAIRAPIGLILPEFVYYYLYGRYQENRSVSSGNNQPALNKARVSEMLLPLPPVSEQERIVAEVERRLSVADALEATLAANLRRATRLRQAVLHSAFSWGAYG